MKAWLVKEQTGIDAMELGDFPDPNPGCPQEANERADDEWSPG